MMNTLIGSLLKEKMITGRKLIISLIEMKNLKGKNS